MGARAPARRTKGLKIGVAGNLRKAIGPKLDVGVVHAKSVPKSTGKLRFTYSW